MIALALLLIVAAMLLVRLGWGGRRGAALAGWSAAAAGLVLLALRDGAWGLAIGTAIGMAMAIALVLQAGWSSPAKVLRPAREAPSIVLPRYPSDLARRLGVFVLVVPVAFAASQWLAFGTQAVARRSGAVEADATVLMLFLQPILWGAILSWQMTEPGPARMTIAPAAAALLGTLLWGLS